MANTKMKEFPSGSKHKWSNNPSAKQSQPHISRCCMTLLQMPEVHHQVHFSQLETCCFDFCFVTHWSEVTQHQIIHCHCMRAEFHISGKHELMPSSFSSPGELRFSLVLFHFEIVSSLFSLQRAKWCPFLQDFFSELSSLNYQNKVRGDLKYSRFNLSLPKKAVHHHQTVKQWVSDE